MMGDQGMKNRQGNKNLKRIYLATVVLFITAVVLFFFQQKQPVQEKKTETANDLIIESGVQEDTMSDYEKEKAAIKKKNREEVGETVTDFIKAYYTYDANNRFKSLEDAKPYLSRDFYEELKKTEDESTKVPIHAYREVTKISLQDYLRMGENHTIIAKTTAELFDEKKKPLSTIGVEFHFNVVREDNEWKISYFALFGKSLESNEE
ncbi:hypothetical protein IHV10_20190 [Fictibacillus sp. 5RED26]|uniref:hypothetical protein n=1 Tax=Fictibacillus sp. 5RED26 TaxID=2745876 RepID=UPI0018CD51FA|nr:hypothetical protein [Fictibacillus sp. 5RED26]MBH0158707.1 hypothetical protein [Fictibacillus sp. 5RED26]